MCWTEEVVPGNVWKAYVCRAWSIVFAVAGVVIRSDKPVEVGDVTEVSVEVEQ